MPATAHQENHFQIAVCQAEQQHNLFFFQDMSKDFDIKRIKRSNTSCSTGVGAHVHPFNEIFYLSSGECTSFIDHNIYKFGKGDLVIVPSGCLHRTTYNGKGMHERIVISFRNDATEWIQNQTGKELMENCMKPGVVNIPEKRRDYVVEITVFYAYIMYKGF